MSRYTFITFSGNGSRKAPRADDLHNQIKQLEASGYPSYYIGQNTYVVLSNGLSRESHYKLYSQLSKYPSIKVRVTSVTHENPVYATIKFSKLASKSDFYYEESPEGEYFIGYFTPIEGVEADVLTAIARRMKLLMEVGLCLLNLGSLPLALNLTGIIAALNRSSIDQMNGIRQHMRVGIGVDFSGIKAVEKAVMGVSG